MNKPKLTYWPGAMRVNDDNYGALEFVPAMGFFLTRRAAEARCSPEAPLVGVNAFHILNPEEPPEDSFIHRMADFHGVYVTEGESSLFGFFGFSHWDIKLRDGKLGTVQQLPSGYYEAYQDGISLGWFHRWEHAFEIAVKHWG